MVAPESPFEKSLSSASRSDHDPLHSEWLDHRFAQLRKFVADNELLLGVAGIATGATAAVLLRGRAAAVVERSFQDGANFINDARSGVQFAARTSNSTPEIVAITQEPKLNSIAKLFESNPAVDDLTRANFLRLRSVRDHLRSGKVTVGEPIDGTIWPHVFTGTLKNGDATAQVAIHFPSSNYADFVERVRVENAAQHLSPFLFGTVEPTVQHTLPLGKGAYNTLVSRFVEKDFPTAVGEASEKLRAGGQELGAAQTGTNALTDLEHLVNHSPEVRGKLEKALVERLVLGDVDIHEFNLRGMARNIDMETAFTVGGVPQWSDKEHNFYKFLADKPLLDSTVARLVQFRDHLHSPLGQDLMKELKLTPKEIDDILSRTDYLIRERKFPPTVPDEQILQMLKARWRRSALI